MLKLILFSFFLSMLKVSVDAAVAIYPPETKPPEFEGVPGCYIKDPLNMVLPYNVPYSLKDGKTCEQFTCGNDNFTQLFTCGTIGVGEGCYIVPGNRFLAYPDCCDSIKCNATTTTEAPTTEVGTTEYSTTENSIPNDSTTEDTMPDNSTTENTIPDNSTTEDSTTEDTTSEYSTTKSSKTANSITKCQTTQDKITQDSTTIHKTTQDSTTIHKTKQDSTTKKSCDRPQYRRPPIKHQKNPYIDYPIN